jgi:predicted DNA-binding transcriptional regulator AlpA
MIDKNTESEMSFEQLCELFGYAPTGRPLDTKAVADLLGVHKSTVDHYRFRGDGPPFFKPPGTRRVWYSERQVLQWLANNEKRSTGEQVAA